MSKGFGLCYCTNVSIHLYSMAQVSRRKLDKRIWDKIWWGLVSSVVAQNNKQKADLLLSGLLTRTEKTMLSKRLMVGLLLLSDWPVRAIERQLKVGTSTIYKVELLLEKDAGYRKLLRTTFPETVSYDMKAARKENFFLDLLEDIWAGRQNRSRLMYEKH